MKVLLITTDCYGSNGGIALYNRDIIESLISQNDVTEVVVLPRIMPVPTARAPDKVRLVASAAGGKTKFIKSALIASRETFDLIICGHINLLPLAVMVSLIQRTPLALMVYGIDVWRRPNLLSGMWLRAVKSIWSISAITTERMNSWAGLAASRYVQLPNAIHLDRYETAPPRADLQDRYGLKGFSVIMTLARLSSSERYKGVDEVIEVLPELLQTHPKLKYLVCGDGDDRGRLMQKVRDRGLANVVVFAGMVSENEKADHFRLADAFIMPSRGEGFGFVFLEALACGIPAVGSKLDGSREALRGGLLGELVDPGVPSTISAGIRAALLKPKLIPAGLDFFSWPEFQNRLSDAVRRVIKS